MKKRLSLLMVLMMVLSLVPMSVFAASGTMPGGRVEADDNEITVEALNVKLTQAAYANLKSGKARLTLNTGEFAKDEIDKDGNVTTAKYYYTNKATNKYQATFNAGNDAGVTMVYGGNTTTGATNTAIELDTAFANVAYVDVPEVTMGSNDMDITLKLWVLFDNESAGDVTLSVEDVDSDLKVADPIKVAVIKEGLGDDLAMVVTDKTKKIGNDGGKLSKVEVKKFDGSGVASIKLELPDYLTWDTNKVSVDGQEITNGILSGDNNNILVVNVADTKKSLLVEPVVKVVKRDASEGDITLKVTSYKGVNATGTKIETVDGVIGMLGNYDVVMSAIEKGKKEIPAMYGGEETTVKVKLAGVVGSFTDGRDIDFTIKGADIVTSVTTGSVNDSNGGIKPLSGKSTVVSTKAKDGIIEDGEFTLQMVNPKKDVKDFEFELKIKTDYAQNGAVVLTAEGRDIGKLECDLAKVTPAYTVEFAKVTPIKKGESLATADIVIKEAKAGMFDTDEYIVLNLRDQNKAGIAFGTGYKIETTNGMKVDDDLTKNKSAKKSDEESIIIDVKTSSSKEAGEIRLSNVVVMASGSAVDGDKMLDTYVTEAKSFTEAHDLTVGDNDKDPDYAKAYVTIVKEYGTVAKTTVFKIGSKEYTVNGESKTANEAPFVSGKGYTMLPVRAVGESLGLKADWNAATKTATFSNDAKVASVVIGADTMYVNGTPFKLSAKAEIKNGSTFVELRSLASAFGVKLEWDAATKSVTIQG